MTKDGCLTLWAGRDDVADLHLLIADDNTIDQKLYQLPLLGKIQLIKRYLEPIAERCDGIGQFDNIEMLPSLGIQLALLLS
jgi:hypothetical protein